MSRPDDDAEASTMALGGEATLTDRSSRPVIETLGAGSTVGRYQLVTRLGAGAMGVVWSARDPELDRDVAIKLVHAALHSDESASRFKREARAMAKLSHRSVITVFDVGTVDGQLFLAMELVRGTTLGQQLRDRDAGSPQESRVIADWTHWLAKLLDAGRGLAEAHKNGVLHRDFKPDNVLVDKTGRVCVGDFGLASLGDRQAPRTSSPVVHPIALGDSVAFDLTSTGAVLGTPLYMSPQQLNAEAIDERADQFAFCVALHEAMYGARPFVTQAEGLAAIPGLVDQIARGVPPPPEDTTVPRGIYDCIARGLAFEPEDRWPDMDTLLAALERAARQRGPTVIATSGPPRWMWVAIGAALAALAIAAAVIWRSAEHDRRPTAGSAAVTPVELIKLFDTPLNSRTAISRDGRFLALASDQLEVREIQGDGAGAPIGVLPLSGMVTHLEVDDQEVKYGTFGSGIMRTWRYRMSTPPVETARLPGPWRGDTERGPLVWLQDRGLGIVKADGGVETWPVKNIEIVTVSPDRKRVAYVEGGRFTGTISVRDVNSGYVVTTPAIDEPMALAWLGPTTLLYASSTMVEPTIYRAEVGAVIGPPAVVYRQATGWFSDLGAAANNAFVVSMSPAPRGRLVERGGRNVELDSVSLAIGWDGNDRMVRWNRSNQQLASHAGTLDSEPANATRVDDTLIAALRVLGGRRAVAVSLSTGNERWRHPDKHTIAVRCAGDRARPCFAIRYIDEDLDRIVSIDPDTGALGTTAIYESRRIEDIAVRADGGAIAITQQMTLKEIAPDGTLLAEHPLRDESNRHRLNLIRSVAYTRTGFVIAGTIGRNSYQVAEVRDGRYEPLGNAYDTILMLARPSADGSKVVFIARGYEPQLYRMKL